MSLCWMGKRTKRSLFSFSSGSFSEPESFASPPFKLNCCLSVVALEEEACGSFRDMCCWNYWGTGLMWEGPLAMLKSVVGFLGRAGGILGLTKVLAMDRAGRQGCPKFLTWAGRARGSWDVSADHTCKGNLSLSVNDPGNGPATVR